MKTTIDIPEPLLTQAREQAALDGTTLRALVEKGLRQVVAGEGGGEAVQAKDARFKGGTGLAPGLTEDDWDNIRDPAYGEWPGDRG